MAHAGARIASTTRTCRPRSLVTGIGRAAFRTRARGSSVTVGGLSSPSAVGQGICSSQCFYDLVVAVPQGQPDTVVIGGVAIRRLRRADAAIDRCRPDACARSRSDAQNPRHREPRRRARRGVPPDESEHCVRRIRRRRRPQRRQLHERVGHSCSALANNAPQCPSVLARCRRGCYFLNKGLQTLQFYNVALDPQAPLTRTASAACRTTARSGTDGTTAPACGRRCFRSATARRRRASIPTRTGVLFASFQSNNFFTNFRNGDPAALGAHGRSDRAERRARDASPRRPAGSS